MSDSIIATTEAGEIRRGHEIDTSRLGGYLRSAIPGFPASFGLRQFTGGQSNPTYLIEADDRAFVLRKKPPGHLLPSAHQIEREYRIMAALQDTDVPVPRLIGLCEDSGIIGTPFFVMEKVEGRIFRDTRIPGVLPREREGIYLSMAETLGRLHAVEWNAVGLSDFGKPAEYVRRQVARWSKQYRASTRQAIPEMDRLMEWLPENVPAEVPSTIVHGDFRLENLILDANGPDVVAVLDWELATLGNPFCDLAHNAMKYKLPAAVTAVGGLADVDIASLGIPSEKQYLDAYCRATGQGTVPDWDYYLAFALFRCAAILQGVYARALDGNASGEDALRVGAMALPVAKAAWSQVMKGE
jgi:aminoglycoside phosphotransferase (APT) family kinase protein